MKGKVEIMETVKKTIGDLKNKREFAQEQYEFLKKNGIQNRMSLSRIFKAAGPGQIRAAWNLATCEDWSTGRGGIRKDLLSCILMGISHVRFGGDRIADLLESAGFLVPEAHSAKCFFRILKGALEILVPGSVRFSKEEMEVITSGLKKKMNKENFEV